ncbi:MAG: hypothetical protein WD749_11815 [Phycisphaerales bacterium]
MRLIAGLTLIAGLAAPLAAVAQQATFALVSPENNEEQAAATHVSADGSVVIGWGGGYLAPGITVWRWTEATGKVRLGAPPGYVECYPAGLTADGSTLFVNVWQGNVLVLWRWSSTGGWQLVGDIGGQVHAVNGDGMVFAGGTTVGGVARPFRWTGPGGLQVIGPFGTLTGGTYLRGLSRDGAVLFGTDYTLAASARNYVWSAGGGFHAIPLLPTCQWGDAVAADRDGSAIVGSCALTQYATPTLPWVWTAAGGVRPVVLTGAGGPQGAATAISGDGMRIAGWYGDYGPAWLWSPTEGDRRVDALLTELGGNPWGVQIRGVTAISDDGRTLVGPLEGFFSYIARIPAFCYANCDGSTAAPALNVQDFGCFLTRYAAGEEYANCDGSTAAPVLNVGDFSCFLQKYAARCP